MWKVDVVIHAVDYEYENFDDGGRVIRGLAPRCPIEMTVTTGVEFPERWNVTDAIEVELCRRFPTIGIYGIDFDILVVRASPT